MKKMGLHRIVHVDSDCVFLTSANELADAFSEIDCGLSIQQLPDQPFHMAACIHNSFLTLEFCEVFIQLCYDVYQNKSKFSLIEPKIKWHQDNRIPGGICDMTLCYIIWGQDMVPNLTDLNETRLYNNDLCVFDHNIQSPYGFAGPFTYMVLPNGMKSVTVKDGKFYATTVNKEQIRLLTMHFQGMLGKTFLVSFQLPSSGTNP
jgi:hypothetical protein